MKIKFVNEVNAEIKLYHGNADVETIYQKIKVGDVFEVRESYQLPGGDYEFLLPDNSPEDWKNCDDGRDPPRWIEGIAKNCFEVVES